MEVTSLVSRFVESLGTSLGGDSLVPRQEPGNEAKEVTAIKSR